VKFTRLLIAAAVLAVLGGLMWWSDRSEKAKEGKSTDTSPKILSLTQDVIRQMEFKPRTGDTTVVKKGADGKWTITAPKPMPADDSAVTTITVATNPISADRIVDEHASDLPSYGLDPALLTVTFTDAAGKNSVLRIGDDTPTGGNSYVMLDGDPRLYTVSSTTKATFNKSAKDLREKHLVTFNSDKVSRVELDVPGKPPIEFGRAGQTDWQILKPKPMRADPFQVEQLTGKIKAVLLDPETDDAKAAAGFASAQPVATVRVTGEEGVTSLEVRKNKDDVYAKSSQLAVKGESGIYKVNKDAADDLAKNVDDFRNKKMFDFGFTDPTRIEYKDGPLNAVWEKTGEKWTSAGKTIDSVSIQNLVDKLRDLAATKFTEGAPPPAAVEITVVSDSGKRTEKVRISAAGTGFEGSRDGDTSLYQLDPEAVKALRQAAMDVKEAQDTSTSKGGDSKGGGKK
jgi:hypothetical protein